MERFDAYFARDTIMDYKMQILGFQLSNKEPGISYNTIGVNGAGLYTYLGNKYFEEKISTDPSLSLAHVLRCPKAFDINSIGIRLNGGKLAFLETNKKFHFITVNRQGNILKITFIDKFPKYE